MVLSCTNPLLWLHVMVVWMPRWAHAERDPKIPVVRDRDETVMVSQFMMELQGLNVVDKEELDKTKFRCSVVVHVLGVDL
ncbi:hypothetical protein DEO72_LG1g2683 [Vigna unguiculata]|uniref:Uncharacterized protein n=1 Tax=Vigna unguiculata TaxID=3917 RepID=A0A4D6KLX2_VIGUN|nr:hypothetical protein DEO72_LG1g2683 [Vigna unguiculata]